MPLLRPSDMSTHTAAGAYIIVGQKRSIRGKWDVCSEGKQIKYHLAVKERQDWHKEGQGEQKDFYSQH